MCDEFLKSLRILCWMLWPLKKKWYGQSIQRIQDDFKIWNASRILREWRQIYGSKPRHWVSVLYTVQWCTYVLCTCMNERQKAVQTMYNLMTILTTCGVNPHKQSRKQQVRVCNPQNKHNTYTTKIPTGQPWYVIA